MKKETTDNVNERSRYYGLATPTIPQADPIDGLLTLETLTRPITLNFPAWIEAVPEHSYQLMVNGLRTGKTTPIVTEKPGDPLTMDIPGPYLIKDGVYEIGYAAINDIGGVFSPSPTVPLIVDRTPPGGDLLAPLLFASHQLPLTEESLAAAGNILTARLPSYFDAKWGDVVRTYWGDQPGPVRVLTAEEVGGSDITFNFERSFLEQLADGDIAVTYTVTDRAGNLSIVSEPAHLRLQLRNHPHDLLAPLVPKAVDGLLTHDDVRHGVDVQIPHYGNAQAGDVILLSWGGLALPGVVLSEAAAALEVVASIPVSFATVMAAGDGAIEVRYEVRREGQNRATSPGRTVNVFVTLPGPQDPMPETLVNEQLAAPQIHGKSDHPNRQANFLDEDDYLLDADVVIAWQTGFQPCDRIQLYWGSWPLPVVRTLDQNDVEAAADLVICMPNGLIVGEGVGRAIPVHYTVTHAGNPNLSHSATQLVRVVRQAQLPGGENGLQGALFNEADETHTLRLPAIVEGATVLIQPYRNMRIGDRIELSLQGFDSFIEGQPVESAALILSTTVDEQQFMTGIHLNIPTIFLERITTGRLKTRYRIRNDYGSATSLIGEVYVDRRTPPINCA